MKGGLAQPVKLRIVLANNVTIKNRFSAIPSQFRLFGAGSDSRGYIEGRCLNLKSLLSAK